MERPAQELQACSGGAGGPVWGDMSGTAGGGAGYGEDGGDIFLPPLSVPQHSLTKKRMSNFPSTVTIQGSHGGGC